ncbi:MAG: hypothetical protein V4473_02110 [Patescibacteria group bacterium]
MQKILAGEGSNLWGATERINAQLDTLGDGWKVIKTETVVSYIDAKVGKIPDPYCTYTITLIVEHEK